MAVRVLYLAWLRERAGLSEETIDPPAGIDTVQSLIDWLRARGGQPARAFDTPAAVRVAVNQRFAKPSAPIAAGDEIAFFPPVTGG